MGFSLSSLERATGPRPRRRRWFVRLVGTFALLLAVLAAVLVFLTRPARLTPLAAQVLHELTGAQAFVGEARLTWRGELQLEQIELRLPDEPAAAGLLFEAEQVIIQPRLTSLLMGRVDARSVLLVRPTLHFTEELPSGEYNLQKLAALRRPRKESRPASLPQVMIEHGMLRFSQTEGERFEALGALVVQGHLRQDTAQPGRYWFVLQQDDGEESDEPALRGQFDLNQLSVDAVVEHFRFDRPQRNLLPRRLRDWWDRLEPQGSLPTIELTYDPTSGTGLRARLDVSDVSLRLPYGPFAPRMEEVSGRFVVENETIRVQELSGLVEGIRYHVNGEIAGFATDAAFSLRLDTQPFTIREDVRFSTLLPAGAAVHMERFRPTGDFRGQVTLSRAAPAGTVEFAGSLDVLDARARYHRFPYPVQQLKGKVQFTREMIEFVDVHGETPSGGTLVISGTIAQPGFDAQVTLHIEGENIGLDEQLLRCLKPKHKDAIAMFIDPRSHGHLIEQGLIQSSQTLEQGISSAADSDGDDPPVFDLGGRAAVVVDIHRPLGKDQKYSTTTTVQTQGVRALYRYWPYPLVCTGGEVVIAPDHVEVRGVTASGLTGATLGVDGRIDRNAEDKLIPRLTLSDLRIPIDDLLLASIPQPKDRWVRELNPQGTLNAQGEIFGGDDGEVDFNIDAQLEASITPFSGSVEFRDLRGQLRLSRTSVRFDGLRGHHGDSALELNGRADWPNEMLNLDLDIALDDLEVGDEMLALLPSGLPLRARLRKVLEQYEPAGVLDAHLRYRGDGEHAEDYRLELRPQSLAFNLADQRIECTDVTGLAIISNAGMELIDLHAQLEGASAHFDGTVKFGDPAAVDLSFSGEAEQFDDRVKVLIPEGIVKVLEGLSLQGGYRVEKARLITDPQATREPTLRLEATMRLINATAAAGVSISDLNGKLNLSLIKHRDDPWPRIELALDADHLRVADRLISPFSMHLVGSEQTGVIQMDHFLGSIYGGSVVGVGAISLAAPQTYQFDLAVQDVEVDPFINPLRYAAHSPALSRGDDAYALLFDAPERETESGLLSGSLTIEAQYDKPQTRRGRGAIEVRDARLYRNPLAMALLQTANLSLPTQGYFDRASARYLIDASHITYESIRFESPSVAIAGTGEMEYPSGKLKLLMFARDPAGPKLGLITEMVDVFKDELVCIQVTGTLGEPHARVESFQGIKRSWDDLFGDQPPRRREPQVHSPARN
jgi:hypothetical protein